MTRQQLKASLRRLGNSPESVARALTQLGIKGTLHDAENCPLAAYLLQEGAFCVTVNGQVIECEDFEISTPRCIAGFVNLFDDFHWPELVEIQEPGANA